MSKAKWNKCSLSGISKKVLGLSDFANYQGEFKVDKFPDCNLFDVSSIGHAAAPNMRADNFKARVLPSSHMHLHQITNGDGETIGYATHVNSAQYGGESYAKSASARMRAGKKITDVSGG